MAKRLSRVVLLYYNLVNNWKSIIYTKINDDQKYRPIQNPTSRRQKAAVVAAVVVHHPIHYPTQHRLDRPCRPGFVLCCAEPIKMPARSPRPTPP
jgi:hypothetical protein